MLGCIVLGEDTAFAVDFYKSKTVSHLKKAILEEKKNSLRGVDANKLILWKVNISESNKREIYTGVDLKQKFGGLKLDNDLSPIGKYFPEEPPEEHIHIIVQPTSITDAPKTNTGLLRLGGLGGTTYQGEESGRAYEGVDLSRDTVCRREQTLNRLLKCLLEKRIILVRSPPMTGKTTLSQLFEHNLLQSRSRVFRISLLWMERRNPSFTFEKGFEDLMKMTWPGFLDQCGQKETFLIVDEVQKIYKPENEDEPRHGGKVFWDPFKVIMQTTRLYIVAFASYGHYGAYTARGDHAVIDISPYRLPESNAWGFADVRFTEEEFCDYFDRFCEKNLKMLQKEDTPLFSRYVSAITAFHPGLVVFTMEQIHARFVKHTFESLTFSKIFAYLKSRDFNAHFEDLRAMPRITDMSDEEKKIVDTVLFKKRGLKIKTNAIPRERRIIKTNILVDTAITKNYSILDFPAPLLRATYLQNRFGSVTRSKTPPNTFRDFVTSVFAKMDPKVLQKSKGTGIDGRLLGRVWQMEFYRASMQVLPEDIHASVDVGAVFGSKGYIDFYIDDQHNWAIELLRDGDRLQEHEERFQERGIYVPILKYAKEWAVIDIRSNTKGFPEGHGKDVIYVVCAENFESVQLMYSDGTKVNVRLLGEEENLLGFDISEFLEDSMETD